MSQTDSPPTLMALLVAEDRPLREGVTTLLAAGGFRVEPVSTPGKVTRRLTDVTTAVVVVQWPGRRGVAAAVCREVAAHRPQSDALVVAVIGPGGAGAAAALDAGAEDVMAWPAEPDLTRARIRILADRLRRRGEWRRAASALRAAEERATHQRFHDPLTGLPDRQRFLDRLERAFERARHNPSPGFAVLFLDVDRFKLINDSLGHVVGDKLLVETARRLEESLRPADTVARLGGDEFAIILSGVSEPRDATMVADRIHQELRVPFGLDGQEVFATASVGIAQYTDGYRQSIDLLRDADTAMYRAKAMGRDRYAVFDSGMHEKVVATLQLENDLRRAIGSREFTVEYQPIVALKGGRIVGFEALVRWHHPRRGVVLPAEFIQTAEETGLIIAVDRWVAAEACRQLRAWNVQLRRTTPLTMSINVSGAQFMQPDLPMVIDRLLRDNALWGSMLKLEITESVIMEKARYTGPMLEHLRGLAIKLSVDDFGTGYSSLSYLRRFEIDTLKIDSSFVARITYDDDSAEIVRATINLARSLGKEMVAEGVETASQLGALRAMGCTHAQGYYFARPLSAEAATKLLVSDPQW